MPQMFNLTLESVIDLNDSVRHFTFSLPDSIARSFIFIPGQFIRLFIPTSDGKPVSRSYSLANNAWDEKGKLQLAASYVKGGVASEYLFKAPVGTQFKSSGPFGKLVLKEGDSPERYFFVSTNTGVTPFRAMLPALEKKFEKSSSKVVLLEGVRSPDDLLYEQDFLKFQSAHTDNFSFYACYSRAQPSKAHEKSGYVQETLKHFVPNAQKDIVYLCGNPNMIDEVFEHLKSQGFPIENIRREKYFSA